MNEVQALEETVTAADNALRHTERINHEHEDSETQILTSRSTGGEIVSIGRVLPTILVGLEHFGDAGGLMPFRGRVTHSCIRILKCLLDRICYLPVTCAEKHADQHDHRTSNTQSRKRITKCRTCKERSLKCDQRTPTCRNCQRNGLNCDRTFSSSARPPSDAPPPRLSRDILKLCELTVKFVNCLDATKAAHKVILEGFLFVFLDRIGKGLKHSVFESYAPNQNDAQEESRKDNPPIASLPSQANSLEDVSFKAQAPYLIWLLQRIQPLIFTTPHSEEPIQSAPLDKNISAFARDQLQNTLLKAVFGDDAPADYEPALESVSTPTDVLAHESAKVDVDVKDWYTHEVWRLLGWDVLRSRGSKDV